MKSISSYIACLWLFVILNSFFVWGGYRFSGTVYLNIFLVFLSVFANREEGESFSKEALLPIVFLSLFMLWSDSRINANMNRWVLTISSLVAFAFLSRWPFVTIERTYTLFKKAIVFFCIGSSIISILGAFNLLQYIPHFTLPPQSNLHERMGFVYYVYGCFVTIYNGSTFLPRACGFLQEPGHFSVIVGLVYMIERCLHHKRNIFLIVGGLFTFSFNFILMFFVSELFMASTVKQFRRLIRWLMIVVAGVFFIYSILPADVKDQLYYLFWERNMEELFGAFQESSSLEMSMDERANELGLFEYSQLTEDEKLFGIGGLEENAMLSDYRGMVVSRGYIGLFLSVCSSFVIIFLAPRWRQRIVLLLGLLLVYLHRAWMLGNLYLYFIVFMGVALLRMYSEEDDETISDVDQESVSLLVETKEF